MRFIFFSFITRKNIKYLIKLDHDQRKDTNLIRNVGAILITVKVNLVGLDTITMTISMIVLTMIISLKLLNKLIRVLIFIIMVTLNHHEDLFHNIILIREHNYLFIFLVMIVIMVSLEVYLSANRSLKMMRKIGQERIKIKLDVHLQRINFKLFSVVDYFIAEVGS